MLERGMENNLSNTFALVEKGWKGAEIEGDEKRFEELSKTIADYEENIIPLCAYVEMEGKNSIDLLLSKTSIPKDFDMISIDIDSYDWQIWNSLKNYTPKIVIVEINSSILPGIEQIHSPTEKKQGSSFSSTSKLGIRKGYKLVCHTGNLIFVRDDLVKKLNLPEEELNNPESLFINNWIPKKGLIKFVSELSGFLWRKSKLYRTLCKKLKRY